VWGGEGLGVGDLGRGITSKKEKYLILSIHYFQGPILGRGKLRGKNPLDLCNDLKSCPITLCIIIPIL
jgi:hypothetical protein